MTDHTHQTAPTQFVDGAGIRFAYRRFGKNQGVPLVFFQHFTGTVLRLRRRYVLLPARGQRTSRTAASESTSSVQVRSIPLSSIRRSPTSQQEAPMPDDPHPATLDHGPAIDRSSSVDARTDLEGFPPSSGRTGRGLR